MTSLTCTICFESCTRAFCLLTACGHRFHSKCLQPWLIQHAYCPLCRTTDITCQHGPLGHHTKTTLLAVIELQRIQYQSLTSELNIARDQEIMYELSLQTVLDNLHQCEHRLAALHMLLDHTTGVDVQEVFVAE